MGIKSARTFVDSALTSRHWVSICRERRCCKSGSGRVLRPPLPPCGARPHRCHLPLLAVSAGAPPDTCAGCFDGDEVTHNCVARFSKPAKHTPGIKTGSLFQGVIEFSLCLLFAKLVSYTFLFWLPLYITNVGEYLLLETPVSDSCSACDLDSLLCADF